MNREVPTRRRAGQSLLIAGSILLAAGILIPLLVYIIEMINCSPLNDLCGLISAYLGTLVGIPCALIGILLLGAGGIRKWQTRLRE